MFICICEVLSSFFFVSVTQFSDGLTYTVLSLSANDGLMCVCAMFYLCMQADAVVEAKLKMSDINCALVLCSLIHQRYADFSALLLESWQKVLLTKKDEKVCYFK